MRILQVNHSDSGGGASVISKRLAAGYQAAGHEVATAVGFKVTADEGTFALDSDRHRHAAARTAIAARARLHRSRARPVRELGDLLVSASEPRRTLARRRGREDFDFPGTAHLLDAAPWAPDVLQLHNLHGGYFDLRRVPELSSALPTVITLHDAWLLSGHCAHSFECERWRTGCGHCPHLSTYPGLPRDATAYNWRRKREIHADSKLRIATPARWLADRIEDSILAPSALEVRVIPQGVDLEVFKPGDRAAARTELQIDPDSFVILFVAHFGRSNDFKDLETLRRAIEEVGQRAERSTLLLCIGDAAPTEKLGGIEARFIGQSSSPEALVPYYRAADVYVQSSLAETFPNTVVEALACGTPVIGTAVGGIPEQIDDGHTGFLVPLRDHEAMAGRVLELAADEDKRGLLAVQAAEQARTSFDLRNTVDAYLGWFEEISG